MIVLRKTYNKLAETLHETLAKSTDLAYDYKRVCENREHLADSLIDNNMRNGEFYKWLQKNAGNNHETLAKYEEIMGYE